jgi:hypothetical protein
MKLISQETLLKEIRRHIPAKHFDYAKKHIEPYVRVYRTESTANKKQFRLYDEETYNMIVNTAIRARKANPSSLEDAEKDFCTLIKAVNNPSVATIYTMQDAANQAGENQVSLHQFLVKSECKPFDFLDTDGSRIKFMDYENYMKAVEFAKQDGPKARPTKKKQEPKKAEHKPLADPQFPVRYAQPSYLYDAFTKKFGFETQYQCRTLLHSVLSFVPHFIFNRNRQQDNLFSIEVADEILVKVAQSESVKDFQKRVISESTDFEVTRLFAMSDVADRAGIPRSVHDRSKVSTIATYLGVGGRLKSENPHVLFTDEEANAIANEFQKRRTEQPKATQESGEVSVSINGLTFSLSKQDALKIAQSIINQIGG